MENKSKVTSVGLGFLDVLCLVFIVLKLIGVIKWSWVWVLSPFWIILLIAVVCNLLIWFLENK